MGAKEIEQALRCLIPFTTGSDSSTQRSKSKFKKQNKTTTPKLEFIYIY